MVKSLKERYGKTALVTGASSGIGLAFAREFARQGLDVVVVARREDRLKKLRRELQEEFGINVHVLAQDLSLLDAPPRIEEWLTEAGIEVDILVNNAGFGQYGEFGEEDLERALAMVDVNCRVVVGLTWRLLPGMKQRKRGAVIIVSSVLGIIPSPWHAVYSATKAFDLLLAEGMYIEMKPHNIDVLAVMPTLTDTEFQSHAESKSPPIKPRTPEQVVKTALGALGRKPSVADGLFTKVWLTGSKLISRKMIIWIYGLLRGPK